MPRAYAVAWSETPSARFASQRVHAIEPFGSPLLAHPLDHSDDGVPNRPDAAEGEDVFFETLETVGTVVPAVEEPWHTHRHDDAGRLAGQELPRQSVLGTFAKCE